MLLPRRSLSLLIVGARRDISPFGGGFGSSLCLSSMRLLLLLALREVHVVNGDVLDRDVLIDYGDWVALLR